MDQTAMRFAREPRTIRSVLATVSFPEDKIEALRRAVAPAAFVHCAPQDSAAIVKALETVDVAIIAGDLDDRYVAAPYLTWVHCDHSGLTRSARTDVFAKGLIVTGSAGRSAEALAQHGFFFALALTFDAPALLRSQANHVWRGIPGYLEKQGLPGKTLGVVGFGHTGKAMAALGKAFGMKVMVYTRSRPERPENVDVLLCAEAGDVKDRLVEESDVIMLATQLTDVTHHMFSTREFERMKPSAFIINMARGSVIDEDALLVALEEKQIAGAGLDVFRQEPLPADSPLWDQPNVLITPHTTPSLPDKTQRSVDIILENIERYRAGRPMINAITENDVYTPRSTGA